MAEKSYSKKISDTSGRLGPVRFSYPYVFTPKSDDKGNEKYSVCVLIPKDDKADISMFNELVEAAKVIGKNTKWGGKIPASIQTPLRDGDEKDDEAFHGCWYFNCWNKHKPEVKYREDGEIRDAVDSDDFYAGCWGAVTINCYPYANNGHMGVSVGLRNLIKTKDDDKLAGGGSSAETDFADLVI